MGLKFKVEKLDTLAEGLRGLYVLNQADNAYYLDVEGVVSSEKLAEFRQNNINLSNQLKAFEGVDPAKYRELVDMQAKGQLHGKSQADIDKILNDRVTAMKGEYETTIETLRKANETQATQLNTLLIDNVVRDAAAKAGVSGSAMDDIILRAQATFKLIDGVPTPHDPRGNVIYGKDGTNPMPVGDWVSGLKTTASHLFPGSQGSGATGSNVRAGQDPSKMTSHQKIAAGLEARANR